MIPPQLTSQELHRKKWSVGTKLWDKNSVHMLILDQSIPESSIDALNLVLIIQVSVVHQWFANV